MTVVSAIKINETEGVMVADAQASYGGRKNELATKIDVLSYENLTAILGGAGAMMFLRDVVDETRSVLENQDKSPPPKIRSARDLVGIVASVAAGVKERFINGYLQSKYRLSERELQTGQLKMPDGTLAPISPGIMQDYLALLSGTGDFGLMLANRFVVLSLDGKNVNIYTVDSQIKAPLKDGMPYATTGTGMDAADAVLNQYFENISRDSRGDLPRIPSVAALIEATDRAARTNVGVGGTPYIAIVHDGKIIRPDENSSKLAQEIVTGTRGGLLPKEFQDEALDLLLYQGADFAKIERKMWKATPNKSGLDRILRGYKG